jgi:DNA-binding response OmpR family regulator
LASGAEEGAAVTVQGNILIVDDEASLRQTLARILQRAGMDVTTAATANEAFDYLRQQPFDLVYLDIRMPETNGLQALKLIHAQYPEVPVVLFTAQPDLTSAVEALREGAADYLLKPLEPRKLIERTTAILAEREKEMRRREIQAQIERLQAELRKIDAEHGQPVEQAAGKNETSDRYLTRGRLTLDLHMRRLTFNKQLIDLPPTAFDYLLVLARHAPNVVDYKTMVSEAQGYHAETREAQEIVKWHVHHIRQAIQPGAHKPGLVINVRGEGYRLVAD